MTARKKLAAVSADHSSPAEALRRAGEALIAASEALLRAKREESHEEDDDVTLEEIEAALTGPLIPDAAVGAILAGTHPVKAMREARGFTQKALAEQIGTAPNYISQIENGRPAGRRMLRKLAEALDVSPDILDPWE